VIGKKCLPRNPEMTCNDRVVAMNLTDDEILTLYQEMTFSLKHV